MIERNKIINLIPPACSDSSVSLLTLEKKIPRIHIGVVQPPGEAPPGQEQLTN